MYRRGNYFSKEYFDCGAYAEVVSPEIACWQVAFDEGPLRQLFPHDLA